jgi:hypothetical protein
MDHEVTVRVRAPLPVHAVELAAAGEALAAAAALALSPGAPAWHAYGVNRLRRFVRRRFSIARPARVRMRARNPWVRARLRFFGW